MSDNENEKSQTPFPSGRVGDGLRIIISGGGTGGHIFPAIAIANALMKINNENEILFVGAIGRMEMEKVPVAGYKIEGLNIHGLQRKLSLSHFGFPIKLVASVMKARQIIKTFKPDAAVGVGGYASGPLLYAATTMKVPSLIQEQNSFPGITNKMLAKRVRKICVAYDGMEKYFPKEKIILTGNPIRQDIHNIDEKRGEALKHFNLSENKKTVLVIGGSLGARTLNESLKDGLENLMGNNIQLIWQTGKLFSGEAKELTKDLAEKGIMSFDFISRMDLAYAAADVVVSRAGASTVSELAVASKPVIFVPSPNVAEDHQTKNAMALVNKNAALIIKDALARQTLMTAIVHLINDEPKQNVLRENIAKLAMRNAADIIANEVYSMIATAHP
jgi:UDP-N-acetylglucosamine--N-acetylmuramyl-(pentapeptide) pyrophosphoryl-undecaprenol N-acetylglucosamine transferase